MKRFAIFSLVVFALMCLLAMTNPGADDFRLWYQSNIENDMRKAMNEKIQEELTVDSSAMQFLINGVYEVFAKDKVQDGIETYLQSIWNNIKVERHLFYTKYYINFPDGSVIEVDGFLNSFHEA